MPSGLAPVVDVIVRGNASASRLTGVPSFTAIADRARQTAETIADRIVVPHPPMPNAQLTRWEIAEVVAYIMSLRQLLKAGRPP